MIGDGHFIGYKQTGHDDLVSFRIQATYSSWNLNALFKDC